MLAPLENLVTVVSGYDLCSNRQHRQSDLFVPLAAIRILLVAVNKQVSPAQSLPSFSCGLASSPPQTYHRFCECCEQLSQWIHLSSIVTLQLFRSARISRPSSSSSLCGLQEDLSAMDPLLKFQCGQLILKMPTTRDGSCSNFETIETNGSSLKGISHFVRRRRRLRKQIFVGSFPPSPSPLPLPLSSRC
jgi:hypothetical protein